MWQTMLLSLGTGIIKMAMPFITKELRKMMAESIEKWEQYAETTPYNWDNLLVSAIKGILCITDPEEIKPVTDAGNIPG